MAKVIILGNGFDISLGLKTAYGDFIDSEIFLQLCRDNNGLANTVKENRNLEGWIDLEDFLALRSYQLHQGGARTHSLREEYTGLHQAFTSYMNSIGKELNFDSDAAKFLMREINADTKNYIFTFNYTNAANEAIKQHPRYGILSYEKQVIVDHVHGKHSDDNIIFGVGDRSRAHYGHAYLFKSYRDNFNPRKLYSLLRGSSEVVFFGYSLGAQDRTYFQDYFHGCSIGEIKDKKIKIYCYNEKAKESIYSNIKEVCENLGEIRSHNDLIFEKINK